MDKFNKFLAVLKKYQFWILCGVVLVAVIVCWWMATIGLASRFADRKTKLTGAFKSVVVPTDHPNQGVIEQIHNRHKILEKGVRDAWDILYRQQKEKNLLPPVLSKDFKRQFENLKPKEELWNKYRIEYRDFIKEYLPTLLEKVDARRPAKENAERAAGGAADAALRGDDRAGRPRAGRGGRAAGETSGSDTGAVDERIGVVDWNPSDYNALERGFEWQGTPSTLAVLMAQEDLWVYEALLRVISNANEGATGYATAAVKQIDALQIGKEAARAWRSAEETIFRAGQATDAAGGRGEAAPSRGAAEAPPPTEGDEAAAGPSAEEQSRQRLMEQRYVDDQGQPVPYTPEYPYAQHFAEFKMMPIYMKLVIDQRRLSKLLVECANSNMPIEVRRVRILKSAGGALNLASQASDMGAGERGSAREASSRGSTRTPATGAGGSGDAASEETGLFDMPVEIYGLIYIYNPPNREEPAADAASTEKTTEAGPANP
jgi:hypothetical protein